MHAAQKNTVVLVQLLFTIIYSGWAQQSSTIQLPKSAADCLGALPLTETLGPVANNVGFGFRVEIVNKDNANSLLPPREYNPVWIVYESKAEGQFEFTINAQDTKDNFNFLVYASPGPWFCEVFKSEIMGEPIRSNFSTADAGTTGLSSAAGETFAVSVGNAFCSPIPAAQGQFFYIVVDTPNTPNKGFTISAKHSGIVNR